MHQPRPFALRLQRGDTVLGLDKRPNSWTQKFPTEIMDLTRQPSDAPAIAKRFAPDVIVHFAAWAKVHQLVRRSPKNHSKT